MLSDRGNQTFFCGSRGRTEERVTKNSNVTAMLPQNRPAPAGTVTTVTFASLFVREHYRRTEGEARTGRLAALKRLVKRPLCSELR